MNTQEMIDGLREAVKAANVWKDDTTLSREITERYEASRDFVANHASAIADEVKRLQQACPSVQRMHLHQEVVKLEAENARLAAENAELRADAEKWRTYHCAPLANDLTILPSDELWLWVNKLELHKLVAENAELRKYADAFKLLMQVMVDNAIREVPRVDA